MPSTPIAELTLDVFGSKEKVRAKVFAPRRDPKSPNWLCRFEIDEPIGVSHRVYGVTSIQALVLSIKTMAAYLYGSELYKQGKLGVFGKFGGDLSVPAPSEFLDKAPYPF